MRWIGQAMNSRPAQKPMPRSRPTCRARRYSIQPLSAQPESATPLNAAAAPQGQNGHASTAFTGPTPSTSTLIPYGKVQQRRPRPARVAERGFARVPQDPDGVTGVEVDLADDVGREVARQGPGERDRGEHVAAHDDELLAESRHGAIG